eukprot:5250677-Karenia_brevis.AAC.1
MDDGHCSCLMILPGLLSDVRLKMLQHCNYCQWARAVEREKVILKAKAVAAVAWESPLWYLRKAGPSHHQQSRVEPSTAPGWSPPSSGPNNHQRPKAP